MDTNVFGASLTRRNAPLVDLYASHLVGRFIVLAAQTVAELRYAIAPQDLRNARRSCSVSSSPRFLPSALLTSHDAFVEHRETSSRRPSKRVRAPQFGEPAPLVPRAWAQIAAA